MEENNIVVKSANNDEFFARSNALIEASYNTTLIESKVIALALINAKIDERTQQPVVKLSTPYLRQELGIQGNGIYDNMKRLSTRIVSHMIIVETENNKKKSFLMYYLINKANFREDGLELYFDSEVTSQLHDLKEKFTITPKSVLMSFLSQHTYRIYELLSVKEYLLKKAKKKDGADVVKVTYDLNELRMRLGLINIDDVTTRAKIAEEQNRLPLSKIIEKYSKEIEVKYRGWNDFKRYVLEPARKELNESKKATFIFSYDVERTGSGGKVTAVTFNIMRHPRLLKSKDEGIEELKNIFDDEPITEKDMQLLLKISDGNIDRIKEVYNMAKEQEQINNLIAWMRKAIEEEWTPNKIPKIKGKNYTESIEIVEEQNNYREYANDRLSKLPEIKPTDSIAIRKMILSLEDENLSETERETIMNTVEIMRRIN